ncbi:hypothetical protein FISHEDRAFT_60952 [Fistulina hepatica ATCC 64428]|uniref:Uncharacterized protein n=1 Tax=Fistulina hepatica ATCC 64428 TaxID=1128425 RepID=A0A0D7A563_9AGAR|nr:hypothetical protein FISHEDRAFT_60952 [Fistulina hepatica ATCC 64428]
MLRNFSLFLWLTSLSFLWRIHAEQAYNEGSAYSSGSLGISPTQHYKESSYTPFVSRVEINYALDYNSSTIGEIVDGVIFFAPEGTAVVQPGALVYRQDGTMVYGGSEYGGTGTFEMVDYVGADHILMWTGEIVSTGWGSTLGIGVAADFHDDYMTERLHGFDHGLRYRAVQPDGEVIFTWKSIDHVDSSESYVVPNPDTVGSSSDDLWDYFHINVVSKDSAGNYLISSRILFDNAGIPTESDEKSSRGILMAIDTDAMTATLRTQWLPWGAEPWFSEYTADGAMLYAAQFGVNDDVQSYRVRKFPWTGRLSAPPNVTAIAGSDKNITVYVTWNGATEVETWELFGSTASAPQNAVPLANATVTDSSRLR